MANLLMPTFALDIGEIVSIVIAIGVILSGIFGQANETKKAKQKRDAAKRGDHSGGGDSVTQLDEIAQRRRQQLETLARKRPGGAGEAQPQNLSVTQAVEREEARAAYQARATADRAQESSDSVRWTDKGDRATENTSIDARVGARKAQRQQRDQQKELKQQLRRRQQEETARRKAEQLRDLQEKQRRDQLLNRQQPKRQQPHVHQPALTGEEPVHRRVALSEEDQLAESQTQHDLDQVYATEDADAPARKGGKGRASLESLLGGRGWREAIILKEVLDRPVGMREDRND